MLRQNQWKVVLFREAPYISEFLFITMTRLSHLYFRVVKRSSIHKLQLGFVNVYIAPIGFSCFTTLNIMYFCRSVCDVVELSCCSTWAANESGFCLFLEVLVNKIEDCPFFKCLLSVTCINRFTHIEFYFIDLTFFRHLSS